jgi:signal transduction histidine kinase
MAAESSLHRRVMTAAAAAVSIVTLASFTVAWLAIWNIGERAFEARLRQTAASLLANLDRNADGTLALEDEVADQPDFSRPRSGWYWQVEQNRSVVLRSRSLGADTLPAAEDTTGMPPAERLVIVRSAERSADGFRVIVAGPQAVLRSGILAELGPIGWLLGALFLMLLLALNMAVGRALSPLDRLVVSIHDLKAGRTGPLPVAGILEIDQASGAINGLLAETRLLVHANRDAAAKLAHSLKTPLAQMSAYAARADDRTSRDIEAAVNAMRRQIDRNLSRLRQAQSSAAGRLQWTDPRDVIGDLIFAFAQREVLRAIRAELVCPDNARVPVEETDLTELLGNLMDNAFRHAASRVRIEVETGEGHQAITVRDDGRGFPDVQLTKVTPERDGSAEDPAENPGTGLGLALARDIARASGGAIAIANLPEGGAAVTVSWKQPAP